MRIMLAEDDAETAAFVQRQLSKLGHDVDVVENGTDVVLHAAAATYDVIVLDRMMPDLDGVAALRVLRSAANTTPVLMLTALGGIADRVDGLDAGADDYLVKPFALPELAARLNALARRGTASDGPTRFEVSSITLDLLRREVTRSGRTVHLQPREFALLEQLIRHAGRVVTRTMLLELVWGFHFDPQTNIVESHLSRLRAKLRDGHNDDPIETVRGAGYRLKMS